MKKRQIIDIIIILVLGATPLLWLHDNQLILGHDAGLTLSPIPHFLDRLYAWTERFSFGSDQAYAMAGFFIHGLEALVSYLGFGLQEGQKIIFVFWFLLPGLTMYYFGTRLSKKLNLEYFALPASALYMFNHFLLQGWFVAERTKFSVYAALPLVMSFLFDWEDGERSTLRTSLYISLVLFILNGEASIPLFGGMLLTVFVFVLFYILKGFSIRRIRKLILLGFSSLVISGFLNAYWFLPYFNFIRQAYSSQVSQAGGFDGVLNWVNYVSENSSLFNIIRLQGIPEWYLNPLHPYSFIFLNNPLLILISFLLPMTAFASLYFIKDPSRRGKILFFSALAIVTMMFMAGSHPPFGAVYVFFINFVPGFVAFRNPFYKFAPSLWFAYAILIGFTINYFLSKFSAGDIFIKLKVGRAIYVHAVYFAIIVVIVAYSFPFLNGSFLDYIRGERSTRITVPQYVFDFGKWSDSPDRIKVKTLSLPPPNFENNVDTYNWGYWSLSPLTSLLTNAPIVNDTGYMSLSEKTLLEALYTMMKRNDPGWKNFAHTLGIQSFLLRKDFAWDSKGSPTESYVTYKKTLQDADLVPVKKFGKWEIYNFKNSTPNVLKISDKINYIDGSVADLKSITTLSVFDPNEPLYFSSTKSKKPDEILKIRNKLFLIPSCVSCNLVHTYINLELYIPLITRDSMFYKLAEFKKKLIEKKLITQGDTVKYFLYKTLVSSLAFDKFIGQKQDRGLVLDSVLDYGKTLEDLKVATNQFFSIQQNTQTGFFLEMSDVLRQEKAIILRNSKEIVDRETLDELSKKYSLLEEIQKLIESNSWKTVDEVSKKFIVNSIESADYDFYYRPDVSRDKKQAEVSYTLDDKAYKVKSPAYVDSWIFLGKVTLPKGQHRLSIDHPLENLYSGNPSVTIASSGEFTCAYSNQIRGLRGEVFRSTFEHRRLSGSRKFYAKILLDKEQPSPFSRGDLLDSTSAFDIYTIEYAVNNDGFFRLSICSVPSLDDQGFDSAIEMKNINIRKIGVPEVVFYSASDSKAKVVNDQDKNDSQVQYSSPIKQQGVVVLPQSFNDNWIWTGNGDAEKFVANGYANGWIVKDDTNDILLKYDLQNLAMVGFYISGISFVISVLYLLLNKRIK